MRRLKLAVAVITACLCTGTFCIPPTDSSQLFLAGTDEDELFLEYYPEYDGWVPWPSSLWRVDVATGETRRIYGVRQLYFVQAEGDYYVAEEPLDNGKKGRIFGVQVSTGRRMNIETHDTPNGTDYDSGEFFLSAGRLVVHTTDGLLLYDVAGDQAVRTIPLPFNDAVLAAFKGNRAVMDLNLACSGECEPAKFLLIDVDQASVVEVPGPMSGTGFYFGAVLAGKWLLTIHTAYPTESTSVDRVLAYSIPDQTWKTVTEHEPVSLGTYGQRAAFVTGGNDQHALVAELSGSLFPQSRIVLLEIETGQSTTVFQASALLKPQTSAALLVGETVRWISNSPQAVYIYDIATGHTSIIPFTIPQ